MITTVSFYATGLNETNFAIDRSALNRILLNNKIGAGIVLLAPLPFGAVFNISAEEFQNYKTADYIEINNEEDKRYGFINNFLQLANGNYAVSYTLDDWANYVLSGQYNVEFDGLTERANVPFLKYENDKYKIDNKYACFSRREELNDEVKILETNPYIFDEEEGLVRGMPLPEGCYSVVYWIGNAKFNGAPVPTFFSGYYMDLELNPVVAYNRKERANTSMVFMVYDESGTNATMFIKAGDTSVRITPGGKFKSSDINSSAVIKSMRFDGYIPVIGDIPRVTWTETVDGLVVEISSLSGEVLSCDIVETGEENGYIENDYDADRAYYQAPEINTFAPWQMVKLFEELIKTDLLINDNEYIISGSTDYTKYLEKSLYKSTAEYATFKFKYMGAEIEIPPTEITAETVAFIGLSADGETALIKIKGLKNQGDYDELTATGENVAIVEKTYETDYRQYKAAKMSAALSMFGSAAGGVASIAGGVGAIASGNIALGIPAVLSGVQGVAGVGLQAEKAKQLTPSKMNLSAQDITAKMSAKLNTARIEWRKSAGIAGDTKIEELERFGVVTSMQFDKYLVIAQRAGFNFAAVKCLSMDIHGIPQQAARRISDALVAGVTLWHTQHPGNKRIVNYGYIQ